MTSQQLYCIIMLITCVCGIQAQNVDVTQVDTLPGKFVDFTCEYNPNLDSADQNELAVGIIPCSESVVLTTDVSKFNFIAAVFGKFTARYDSIKSLSPTGASPFVYVNTNSQFVKDKTVQIGESSTNRISLKILASQSVNNLCGWCGQVVSNQFTYNLNKKIHISVHTPPKPELVINSQDRGNRPITQKFTSDTNPLFFKAPSEQLTTILCVANNDKNTINVLSFQNKQGVTKILSTQGSNNISAYIISNAGKQDSGLYVCEVTSSNSILQRYGENRKRVEISLAVSFAPVFEFKEIIRHTNIGDIQEVVQIKVSAYPAPELTCSPDLSDGETVVRQSFDESQFSGTFKLTLMKLLNADKRRVITCTAKNEIGQSLVKIKLSAFPSKPIITSQNQSQWYNSYNLKWRHESEGNNVQVYKVYVTYLDKHGGIINTTVNEVNPEHGGGSVKLLSPEEVNDRRTHNGVVYGLLPASEHRITVEACNQHGCEKSVEKSIVTQDKSDSTYNDPQTPLDKVLSISNKKSPVMSPDLSLLVTFLLIPTLFSLL